MPITGDTFYDTWRDMVTDAMIELGEAWGNNPDALERLVYLAIAAKRDFDEDDDAWAA